MKTNIKFIPHTSGEINQIDEKEFRRVLLKLIKSWTDKEITDGEFIKASQELIGNVPQQIDTFEDKDLGWAKYWIEEILWIQITQYTYLLILYVVRMLMMLKF